MAMMYGSSTGLFWLWPLLLVVGAGVVAWAVTHPGSLTPARVARRADSPHELLRERFARGEITEEQLRQALRALDER